MPSLRRAREGRAPLTTACVPRFGLLKVLFSEHHVTARLQQ